MKPAIERSKQWSPRPKAREGYWVKWTGYFILLKGKKTLKVFVVSLAIFLVSVILFACLYFRIIS